MTTYPSVCKTRFYIRSGKAHSDVAAFSALSAFWELALEIRIYRRGEPWFNGILQFLTLIFRRFGKISVFNIETSDKEVKKQLDIQTRQMLGEVIEANLNYLVRFATIRIGSKADAEDIVHEAVRKILEADIFKIKKDSIRMYLFRIVYNLCKDFYLSDRNIRPLSETDDEIPDTSKEEELDMEEIERLNSMLENLPEREAEVVRMNVMDELSFVEISQILSTPASTVKSRFKSGMDKLRKQYLKNQ